MLPSSTKRRVSFLLSNLTTIVYAAIVSIRIPVGVWWPFVPRLFYTCRASITEHKCNRPCQHRTLQFAFANAEEDVFGYIYMVNNLVYGNAIGGTIPMVREILSNPLFLKDLWSDDERIGVDHEVGFFLSFLLCRLFRYWQPTRSQHGDNQKRPRKCHGRYLQTTSHKPSNHHTNVPPRLISISLHFTQA
ncbi:hypothetical protein QBC45DRAFT_21 [Copromyces sp. CBS 386.78]|nr:hypothetical protein QBC45DRAFT_21 [Copromyces sp. CBS 386.78]